MVGMSLVPRVMAERAVHLAALHEHATDVTQVGVAGGARRALATGRHEPEDDVVARLDAMDARPDLLDDTGAFVAADHGQRHRHVAGEQVLVGVAHARRSEPTRAPRPLSAHRARSARRSTHRVAPTRWRLRSALCLPGFVRHGAVDNATGSSAEDAGTGGQAATRQGRCGRLRSLRFAGRGSSRRGARMWGGRCATSPNGLGPTMCCRPVWPGPRGRGRHRGRGTGRGEDRPSARAGHGPLGELVRRFLGRLCPL